MYRDAVKFWKEEGVFLALWGIESQSAIDPYMAARVLAYDGISYRDQIRTATGKLFPVLSIVIYYGMTKWTRGLSLREIIRFPRNLERYFLPRFNDYRVNLLDITRLSARQIRMLRSDLRVIATFF